MEGLFLFDESPKKEDGEDPIVRGGISAQEYLKRVDQKEQYARLENLVVPFGLFVERNNMLVGGGGDTHNEGEYAEISESDFANLFGKISKNLGGSSANVVKKKRRLTKKNRMLF